jgi:MtfA peptidase
MVYIILAISLLTLLAFFVAVIAHHITKRKKKIEPVSDSFRRILENDIPFYQKLNPLKKKEFEERVMYFLGTTQITGVRTNVEDIDKIYIASSAIIPIFGFPNWKYGNLNEVLLYPDSFSHEFEQTGEGRHILGMVGHGAMNNTMILSQQELRQAFTNKTGKENTAIHEFVHLIDKSDGYVDGVPEVLVNEKYTLPWLQYIREEIKKIEENKSDIHPYATTSEAEFFSVASEYFFERPDLLKTKHPELYSRLAKIFNQ